MFESVYTVEVSGSTNRELFAAANPAVIEGLKEEALRLENAELRDMMVWTAERLDVYEKGAYLLTDDKAAVELLGMQVIDELIRDELGYYKTIFKEQGIGGLLESM